jgi:Ca2+-binding EF-hand superfamily protein
LSSTQEELAQIQREFLLIDKDKSGTLTKNELQQMATSEVIRSFELNWDDIVVACDFNNDGVIDF